MGNEMYIKEKLFDFDMPTDFGSVVGGGGGGGGGSRKEHFNLS